MSPRSHGAAAAVTLMLALTACGAEETAAACSDEACPEGQRCGASGTCEPLHPPTTVGDLGRFTSVGLRSDGRVVVSTYDSTYRNLVLITDGPDDSSLVEVVDGWAIEDRAVVDTDAGRWSDLVVDDEDVAHVVWFEADGGRLRYGRRAPGGAWTYETVDGDGPAIRGTHASVAERSGVIHVAYRDESTRQLRYARRERDGTWSTRVVDGCANEAGCPDEGAEDYGEFASIAVIGQLPRIAFYDRARGDLKMASRTADGPWETTTLDGRDAATGEDTGDVGRFVSLALTAERKPGLAYFDASRGALRYLLAGQEPLVVDDGVFEDAGAGGALRSGPVGQHVQLRYDGDGRAVMIYLDGGALAMKLAVVSGSQVVSISALDDLAPGGFVDFDILDDGSLVGAYGPWVPGEAPRTRLERFHLPVDAP